MLKKLMEKLSNTTKKYENSYLYEDELSETQEDFIEDDIQATQEYQDDFADFDEENQEPESDLEEEFGEEEEVEDLPIDVYQNINEIVVVAFIPGVTPSQIDISLTRDMITIEATRPMPNSYPEDEQNILEKELYWGKLKRTILLPEEVDSDNASAHESRGVLTITLPRINKSKKTKIKVKSR